MEPQAVAQAFVRLQKAEKTLQALEVATNYDDAESAWIDFLIAASAVYSKLEQGAKSKGSSQGWFGRKKKERKDDPLLRYLHHARNSEEHGIERVVARGGNPRDLPSGRPLKFGERVLKKLEFRNQGSDAKWGPIDGYLYGPTLTLVRVHDSRFGDYCDPPTEHLGQKIGLDDNHIHGVGMLGFKYLTALVAEAHTLV
jgi:hypothetical protein